MTGYILDTLTELSSAARPTEAICTVTRAVSCIKCSSIRTGKRTVWKQKETSKDDQSFVFGIEVDQNTTSYVDQPVEANVRCI